MKPLNFRKSQEWEMSMDRKADKKVTRSFNRSERFQVRKEIKKQAKPLFLHNGKVYSWDSNED